MDPWSAFREGSRVSNPADIWRKASASFAVTTTGADADDLPAGRYVIWCDVTVFVRIHETDASDVTAVAAGGKGGMVLFANNVEEVVVRENHHLGAVTGAGAGTFFYHRI